MFPNEKHTNNKKMVDFETVCEHSALRRNGQRTIGLVLIPYTEEMCVLEYHNDNAVEILENHVESCRQPVKILCVYSVIIVETNGVNDAYRYD